jgi:hypothetical protein
MLEIGSTFDCLASQCGLRGCTGYRREKGRQSGEFCEFASVSALPFARQTGRTRRKSPLVIWNIPNFQRGVLETGRMFDCLAGLPVTILLLRISLAPPVLPRPKFSAGFRARTSPIPSPSMSSIPRTTAARRSPGTRNHGLRVQTLRTAPRPVAARNSSDGQGVGMATAGCKGELRHCGRRHRLRRRLLQISRSQNNGLSVIAPGLHSRSSRWWWIV